MAGQVKPIPVPVILAAVNGDENALANLVAHYQKYIRALATRPKSGRGNPWATTYRQVKDTRALNARKALRAAPISMGRGEIPVELCQQPSVFCLFSFYAFRFYEREYYAR